MKKFFPRPFHSISNIRTNYIEERFNYFLENEITNKKHWGARTVNGLKTILVQLFNYGIRKTYLTTNPDRDTKSFQEKPRNIVEFFSDEELNKIWKVLDEHWIDTLKYIVHTELKKVGG